MSDGHSLLLFIFLEEGDGGGRRGRGSEEWGQGFSLVQELRAKFDSLVVEQCKKFQQAAHSALNKLICNYGVYNKVSRWRKVCVCATMDVEHLCVYR